MSNDDIGKSLHHIDTRLTLVEADLSGWKHTKRWIQGIAVLFLIQAITGGVAMGRLFEKVDTLSNGEVFANVSRLNQIAVSHADEIRLTNENLAGLRGVMDNHLREHGAILTEIAVATKNRFYREDGLRLEARILRLETGVINRLQNNRSLSDSNGNGD